MRGSDPWIAEVRKTETINSGSSLLRSRSIRNPFEGVSQRGCACDRIVGRVDLKADRKNSSLLVLSAHQEEGADTERVAAELWAELRTLADWLGLEKVVVRRKGSLSRALFRGQFT